MMGRVIYLIVSFLSPQYVRHPGDGVAHRARRRPLCRHTHTRPGLVWGSRSHSPSPGPCPGAGPCRCCSPCRTGPLSIGPLSIGPLSTGPLNVGPLSVGTRSEPSPQPLQPVEHRRERQAGRAHRDLQEDPQETGVQTGL